MIRNPLGLRLDPNRAIRDQIQQAARLARKASSWRRPATWRPTGWVTPAVAS